MKHSLKSLAEPMLHRLKKMWPLPPKEDGTAARYEASHFYNAILAYFLDASEEEQERIVTMGWIRMLEVYGEEMPRDMKWRKKAAQGGKGGAASNDDLDINLANGPVSRNAPEPPELPRKRRGGSRGA